MTACDANAHLGHWPLRRLPFTGVDALLARMDALGIHRAAVANTHAVLYRNAHEADRELAEWIVGRRDRLVPVATIDPAYPGARDDLAWCDGTLGAKAVRLLPRWHGYDLSDPSVLDIVREAAGLGMIIVVPGRMEDLRQRHRLAPQTDVSLDETVALAAAIPRATVLATETYVRFDEQVLARLRELPNLLLETSRLPGGAERTFAHLVQTLGAGRFLLGTGMPFKAAEPSLLKLETIVDPAARAAVAGGTFARLFG